MVALASTPHPWIRRLDHMICEVPDIEEAMDLFVNRLDFPEAWPIGPFWPSALTSGVALGGVNLEFVQPTGDSAKPSEASIRTLVFEPTDLQLAQRRYEQMSFPMELREKWEANPDLLKLRGFESIDEAQLICRNLVPTGPCQFDFFLCDYSRHLKQRLAHASFTVPHPIAKIVIAGPREIIPFMNSKFPLGMKRNGPEIGHGEEFSGPAEVVQLVSNRGPLDLGRWPARFEFV